MSLLQRKPRPLKRDSGSLRDDRLFIVACDDTYAPDQYFNFFRLPRVQVKVIPTEDNTSHAEHVLNRLKQFDHDDDDELWMLLDTDHCTSGAHLKNFNNALRDARNADVRVALSKPCFELWLLLHHIGEEHVSTINNAKQTESALRQALGDYDKTSLKPAHFPLAAVALACQRAARLDLATLDSAIPQQNTSRVYLLWQAIIAKALPAQLPAELQNIVFD
jgi:RloB-like protein